MFTCRCFWSFVKESGSKLCGNAAHFEMFKINAFCRLCFRLRTALLCWFLLSFTTCFSLHGHLQECRIFYFCMLEGFCFAAFFCFFSHGDTLHVSICVFSVLFSFVIFVVFLHVCLSACFFFVVCLFCQTDRNITCKTDWTIQCSRMLKYSET
jgi:hypothetical protein